MRNWVLVLLALIVAPSVASADTINFAGVGKADAVHIQYRATDLDAWQSLYVWAGELKWTTAASGLPASFYTYCVDLMNEVEGSQNVEIKSTTEMPDSDTGAKLAWLFNANAATIHSSGTTSMAAALQLLMWDLLTDGDLGLHTGNFQVQGNTWDALALNYYNGLVSAGSSYLSASATWLDATPSGQDQITTSVPEPATLLLMGVGLAGLGIRRRRLV